MSKLSDVVKNDVIRKADYNKLITKVDNIDTSCLVKKTDYNTKITEMAGTIPHTSSIVKKTDYNTKICETGEKIFDTNNLATKTALTAAENKIPNTSNFATKATLTTVENKIPDISSLVEKSDYNREIKDIGIKINNLQTYSLSYFRGKQYFDEGSGKQNYLVFLPMRKYFKLNSVAGVTDCVYHGNPKEYQMKVLSLLQHLIIVSIQD